VSAPARAIGFAHEELLRPERLNGSNAMCPSEWRFLKPSHGLVVKLAMLVASSAPGDQKPKGGGNEPLPALNGEMTSRNDRPPGARRR